MSGVNYPYFILPCSLIVSCVGHVSPDYNEFPFSYHVLYSVKVVKAVDSDRPVIELQPCTTSSVKSDSLSHPHGVGVRIK